MANPLSELQTHLRPSLKASLLQVAGRNLARGAGRLRLFEIGHVYERRGATTAEPWRLGLVLGGLAEEVAWFQAERQTDFYDLSGITEFLAKNLDINVKDISEAAVLTPADAKAHGIKTPLFYAEIALDPWLGRQPQPERYQPVPTYPPIRRDLAVVVTKGVPQATVEETIRSAKAPNLESVHLFDVFRDPQGEKISAEQKSLAYALTYRSAQRTLTEKEVNEAQELVREKLVAELACTFRE